MLTHGRADFLRANIHSFLGLALIASVSLWFGVRIWQAAGNSDPLAKAITGAVNERQALDTAQAQ